MKVVMTVDIPIEDYTAISELDFHANINIFPGVTTTMHHYSFENVVVRPLPEMIDADAETDMSGGDDYASGYRDGWYRGIEIGWNRYRKAITGEKNEE